ncbi:MAG: DMT family transporter [Desulfatibacillum sp.]|nr:DMT family transporter [Desulfatibacillum sp.]
MNNPGRNKRLSPELASMAKVFSGGVIISFSPVLFKISGASPTAGSFGRTIFGGIFLLILALIRKEKPFRALRGKGVLPLLSLCGILFCLDLEFWHVCIGYVGPGLATIITNFQAVILAVFGVILFKERVTPFLAISIIMAFVGLWFLVGVDVSALPRSMVIGVAWGLGAALWYSLYILAVRNSLGRMGKLPAVTNMAWISLATAFFVGVTALTRGADFSVGGASGFLILVVYGIGPQALGWLLISSGLPGMRASVAGLIILIQPTLAFVWDIVFFDLPAGPVRIAGAVLALAAIYMGSVGRRPVKDMKK